MIERDPIERRLMLARTATWAPEASKARVRANLAASGALSPASGARAAGVTKLTTALLVGASFIAGYWLGFQRSTEPGESALAASTAERAPESATPATDVSGETNTVSAPPIAIDGAIEVPPDPEPPRPASTASDAPRAQVNLAHRATPRRTGPSDHPRATPRRARLARAPAASGDPAAAELALLSRAERAIRSGEPLLALSFVDELDARFPASAMLEERTAARLLAECALSNPGARRRAELFLEARAASVYTDRVRRSCGLGSASATPADGSSSDGH